MKIEAGKYYKTRDGRKVGPMTRVTPRLGKFNFVDETDYAWTENGSFDIGGNESDNDLISEWQDESPSPIRTVTRREIVAGVYGCVTVESVASKYVGIKINQNMDAEELREAAHILNQIAEVLEENGK